MSKKNNFLKRTSMTSVFGRAVFFLKTGKLISTPKVLKKHSSL